MTMADVSAELDTRGGLLPLMHLFPSEQQHAGLSIPWEEADEQLQRWMTSSSTYKEAIRELEMTHMPDI